MQRNLKLGNSIKDCSFVEMNSYANMRTMNTSNSQDSELSSSESKGSDLSRIKNSVQDINSFTSEHVLFSDCILDKNSSREKVKQTKTTETYNRGKMLKISNCLKINWLRKVSNLKSSLLNKLISRLNFQNNGKINQFNLKSLFRKVKGKNTNPNDYVKSKRKSTKKKNKNQAKEKKPDNANFDLEHKVHNVIIPKDSDYLNSFKVNYNEFSSDIFVNSMDSSRESRLNLINATDTTDGNPFALDIKCD